MTATIDSQSPDEAKPVPALNESSSDPMILNRAALIGTFYYQRDLIEQIKSPSQQMGRDARNQREQANKRPDVVNRLIEHLTTVLELTKTSANNFHNKTTKTLLRCFNPVRRAAHDIWVVQLALNAKDQTESAAEAWPLDLWLRLTGALNQELLQGAVGYTLIYQAVLTADISLNKLTLANLLPTKKNDSGLLPTNESYNRLLHLWSLEKLRALAVTDILNGRVWLLDIPIHGDGLKAATIYVAVCPEKVNDQFVAGALYGPNAKLLMPDLIAHKSYHQIRQYRDYEKEIDYSQTLKGLRKTTVELLAANQQPPATDKFDDLVRNSRLLIGGVARLGALRISLAKQLYNYKPYAKDAKDGQIVTFHHAHMQTVVEELKLKVEEGESVLKATDTAVNIIEASFKKAEEKHRKIEAKRQQLISVMLAVLGVALAVPKLIDEKRTDALWAWYEGADPEEYYKTLQLLGIQLLITTVIAVFVVLLIMAIYRWMRADGKA